MLCGVVLYGAGCTSLFLFFLSFRLLALHHDQNELVIRRHQDLVLGGLQPHELEFIVGVEVAHRVLCLCD